MKRRRQVKLRLRQPPRLPNWYVIEQDGTDDSWHWCARTERLRSAAQINPAHLEGSLQDMLAIARAIRARERCARACVAVDARRRIVKLWSPRNSRGVMTHCTRALADSLAQLITSNM